MTALRLDIVRIRLALVPLALLLCTAPSASAAAPEGSATDISAASISEAMPALTVASPSADSSVVDTTSTGGYRPLDTLWSDVGAGVVDAGLLFTAPLRFDGTDWSATAAALGLVGVGAAVDVPVRKAAADTHSSTLDWVTAHANTLGTVLPVTAASAVVYSVGLAADWPRVRLLARHTVQSVIYAAVITTTIKFVAGRGRPFLGNGPGDFQWFETRDDHNSLPSGHTTLVFAVASSISADLDFPPATVALYSIATLTGLSRIYVDRHWTSDVVLGAAIGTAVGYGVVHLHDPESSSSSMSWRIVPTPNGIGIVGAF